MWSIRTKIRKWKGYGKDMKPESFYVFICILNFIIYFERGIIPGANKEFVLFVRETLNTSNPDAYVGILQSAFVFGMALVSPVIGHMIHLVNAQFLIAGGLLIWSISVIGSAAAGWIGSYALLLIGRILSGAGEASFLSIAPPFIIRYSKEKQGRWMGIYYLMLPLGTASGFALGGVVGNSSLGWESCYAFASVLAMIFATGFLFIPKRFVQPHKSDIVDESELKQEKEEEDAEYRMMLETEGRKPEELLSNGSFSVYDNVEVLPASQYFEDENLLVANSEVQEVQKSLISTEACSDSTTASFKSELLNVCLSPIYWCAVICAAAYSAVVQSLSTFASPFLLFLGYLDDEAVASLLLGAMITVSSITGSYFGGWVIDNSKITEAAHHHDEEGFVGRDAREQILIRKITLESYIRIRFLSRLSFYLSFVAAALLCLLVLVKSFLLFLTIIFTGMLLLFSTQAALNLTMMLSIPVENRAFGVATAVLLQHLFGDVPFVVLVGYAKDRLAPHCIFTSSQVVLSKECLEESFGIRLTVLLIDSWIFWMAAGSLGAWLIATFVLRKRGSISRFNHL